MEKTTQINRTFIGIGIILFLGNTLSCAESAPEEDKLGVKSQALTGESPEASPASLESQPANVKQPPADINAEMDQQPLYIQYRYYKAKTMSYEQVVATYKGQLQSLKEQKKESARTPGKEQLAQDMEEQIDKLDASLKEKKKSLSFYKKKLKELEPNAS
jgi:predicted RNase H-like nuclease (RuvC/YqgF family)